LNLGSDLFQAQYQQAPVPPGGALIKRYWIARYEAIPADSGERRIVQSWDTAIKAGEANDWSVCTTWLAERGGYNLIDVVRLRAEYPELRRVARPRLASPSPCRADRRGGG